MFYAPVYVSSDDIGKEIVGGGKVKDEMKDQCHLKDRVFYGLILFTFYIILPGLILYFIFKFHIINFLSFSFLNPISR